MNLSETRLKHKDLYIKRVVGGSFDVFLEEGWDQWSRVLFTKSKPEVRVVAGRELGYLTRMKIQQLIRRHWYA